MTKQTLREMADSFLEGLINLRDSAVHRRLDALLARVRDEALEEAADLCKRRSEALIPTDDELGHERGLEAMGLEKRIRELAR